MKKNVLFLIVLLYLDTAFAVEFEPLNQAISKTLGSTRVAKKTAKMGKSNIELYYTKAGGGKAAKMAFVEHGIYDPNCTHTWVIGVDGNTLKVTGIRVVEMSCPHAFPTKEASYLDQYKGKGPAESRGLSSAIATIAKATGSCNLTTDAVKRSLAAAKSLQGKLES